MNTATKWIIGIVVGLILLTAIVGIGYLAFSRWPGPIWVMRSPGIHPWEDGRGMPLLPFRGLPAQRFIGFFPLRFLGGGLIFTGALVLIVLGVIWLVRSLGRPQPSSPLAVPTPAPAVPQPAAQACPNCKRPVQEDWSHCPYCGADLPQT